ncbi:alpha/beta fold hydrolase [Altererythrobacter aurantiacus]|uniref:Alpha/beta fold hydrolase n=1 Tax=Parapontixanthobacter aurantiacus TaxID=1463599 RepID=A0A844ZCF2_9SPHN|nr:S9 family peptidase [Parapontixanthobacter aurantiacus]MXO84687.1 alpha/beta fold hydrolase [Parapontixanthobacter aurantiacus]
MTDNAELPLIPREHLFGNPERAGGQISPDGKWLSWLAPLDGVLNIWIAPSHQPDDARAMTHSGDRPISSYTWSPKSDSLLYIQDKDGDENYLLYQVNLQTGKERTLTLFEDTRVQIVGTSRRLRDRILIGLNNRDARFHDIWMLNLDDGELSKVFENDSYAGFLADDDLNLRMAIRPNEAGGQDFFRMNDGRVEEEPFVATDLDDALTTGPAGFTRDGKTLYWLDSRDRDTAALTAMDWETGATTQVAEHEKADIGGTIRDRDTGEVQAYSVEYLTTEWTALDEEIGRSLHWLGARLEGDFGISSRTDDNRIWIVWNDPLTEPTRTYVYDRDEETLVDFYTGRPQLEGAPLQPMQAVEIRARDGLVLPSYLTLPQIANAADTKRPTSPLPMVLLVHGGPWARDSYGYNAYHQWLANRGYAVLSVNFRGSTGFGKRFIEAGNLEWGARMQDDLIDAVDWAVDEGIAHPDKVAIMGGSYGGYAALAGLTFTPETFACGIDIVGPSNLETLLETIPPYWEPVIRQFHDRMGNPNTEEGLALLKERSPLHSAEKIKRPLLIGQGANDPRVNKAESDQIVAAMQAKDIAVTYILFPDEGHGFAKPENSIAFNAITENFLANCLGGRAEPVNATIEASSAQVVTGEEFVRGLTQG